MTWQHIDENTYIDDTLITCAEYQLFIDEMREQGKYYQPDHWTSYQFLMERAKDPILGARHSDAEAFCEWLISREDGEWRFRLPVHPEADRFPIKPFGTKPLGYWINNDEFVWIGIPPKNPRTLDRARAHLLARKIDLDFARDLYNAHTRAIEIESKTIRKLSDHSAIDLALDLALDHARVHAFDLDRILDRARALDRALLMGYNRANAKAYVLDRDQAGASVVDQARARIHTFKLASELIRDIDHALARDHARVHTFDLDRVLDRARALDHALEIASKIFSKLDRGIYRDLTREQALRFDHDIFVDIFTLQERIAGRSPAFEGIRLVKERIR